FVFEACLEMDPSGPDVDVALRRQIAPVPRGVFVKPTVLQAADGGCQQPGSVLAACASRDRSCTHAACCSCARRIMPAARIGSRSHSKMPWPMWVVLIDGSTGAALRRPPE